LSLNPDVTSVTSFPYLNSGLDDLSSLDLRDILLVYIARSLSKKSRFFVSCTI
jgi:hypothetical protein